MNVNVVVIRVSHNGRTSNCANLDAARDGDGDTAHREDIACTWGDQRFELEQLLHVAQSVNRNTNGTPRVFVCSNPRKDYHVQIGDRRIMWHGLFLFLLGLLTGTQQQRFKNPRMGLSAHLEGVMNGTFLIAVGAIWDSVGLRPGVKTAARWITLYGAYSNWLFTMLGAAFGTNAANPLSAAGYKGKPWQEKLEELGFLSVLISIISAVVLLLWGVGRRTSFEDAFPGAPDKN